MHLVNPSDYGMVQPLFTELAEFNFYIRSVFSDNLPGSVYMDNPIRPRSALLITAGEMFLGGDPANQSFTRALSHYFDEHPADNGGVLYLTALPGWFVNLDIIVGHRAVVTIPRRRYHCTSLAYTHWRDDLPDQYTLCSIDKSFLKRTDLNAKDHIKSWAKYWQSTEAFLENGFGACIIHDSAIVSQCVVNCVSGDVCEIGITTVPDHRRRGLAKITVAAVVEYALLRGFVVVGWQCSEDGPASWKTAERVGFFRERDYHQYHIHCNLDDETRLAQKQETA